MRAGFVDMASASEDNNRNTHPADDWFYEDVNYTFCQGRSGPRHGTRHTAPPAHLGVGLHYYRCCYCDAPVGAIRTDRGGCVFVALPRHYT
jgi:hypothetical protein